MPSFHPLNIFGRISSSAARSHRNFGWKSPHRDNFFIILSFTELKQPNLAKLCRLRTRINSVNFVRIVQVTRPLGAIIYILVKFHFLSFGGRKPTPLSRSRWNLTGRSRSSIPAKFHIERCNVSPLRGENPKNRPVSKNNTRKLRFAPPAGNQLRDTKFGV